MLMGSGPEGTFGSEISAPGNDWEEEGGRDYTACACPASVFRKRVSPAHHL